MRFLIIFFLSPIVLLAQLSQPKNPVSWTSKTKNTPTASFVLSPPDAEAFQAMQQRALQNRTLVPMGQILPTDIDFSTKADSEETIEKTSFRRLIVQAKSAKGLTPYLEDVFLPIGSQLYVYSPDHSQHWGPYKQMDIINGKLAPGMIDGDQLIIEVTYPTMTKLHPTFQIKGIGYYFGNLIQKDDELGKRDFGDSENCQVNVNCEEGDAWRKQQRSVVRIKMRIQNLEGWCTGTIMNNTNQDCTPYILTADHCRSAEGKTATGGDFDFWQFYFNYEGPDCKNPKQGDVVISPLTGCVKVANSKREGSGGPDFLLLKLDKNIPQFYNPFFAGWNNQDETSSKGVMIHHPSGDVKKISTYTIRTISDAWEPNILKDTHWKVHWSSTSNGHGVSEPGSSGSALWSENGHVIGTLTGGASSCKEDPDKGVSPNFPDYFGKLSQSFSWLSFDSTSSLYYYLDASKSHRHTIEGIEWPCSEGSLKAETQEEKYATVQFFPNPATNYITLSSDWKYTSVQFFDQYGEQVTVDLPKDAATSKVDISNLSSGLYFMVIELNDGTTVNRKLIKL